MTEQDFLQLLNSPLGKAVLGGLATFGMQQLLGPPVPSQTSRAMLTQSSSHIVSQQNESSAQTASQHARSVHPGAPAVRQSWSDAGHTPGWPSQRSVASPTQMPSQLLLQQNASTAQTVSQHSMSVQPAPPSVKQS